MKIKDPFKNPESLLDESAVCHIPKGPVRFPNHRWSPLVKDASSWCEEATLDPASPEACCVVSLCVMKCRLESRREPLVPFLLRYYQIECCPAQIKPPPPQRPCCDNRCLQDFFFLFVRNKPWLYLRSFYSKGCWLVWSRCNQLKTTGRLSRYSCKVSGSKSLRFSCLTRPQPDGHRILHAAQISLEYNYSAFISDKVASVISY